MRIISKRTHQLNELAKRFTTEGGYNGIAFRQDIEKLFGDVDQLTCIDKNGKDCNWIDAPKIMITFYEENKEPLIHEIIF